MKVLIVDDNPQARRMICKYLRASNAEIAEREDGSEALLAYQKFQPDWVLLDWEMKNLNGMEATRQIIKSYPQAQILTLPITANRICVKPLWKPEPRVIF
jgi:two-component system response regulator DegU